MTSSHLKHSYDTFERVEEAFQTALGESLEPRGPDFLYDLVAELSLPAGASVLDLGCGRGQHAVRLAKTFDFAVLGIDPVPRRIELANEWLEQAGAELRELVRFELGSAESIPVEDASVDLVWCRETLYLVAELDAALAECRRVLREDGRMLTYQQSATGRLEPREAEWLWDKLGIVPTNADPAHVEAAFARSGFRIERDLDLGSEFGEFSHETTGEPARRLLHTARLLREPERYIARFGKENYDIMLSDCLWHVYRLLGKLSSRVYLLRAAS